ncbi:YceI family protein [Halpernia sp. GG3]
MKNLGQFKIILLAVGLFSGLLFGQKISSNSVKTVVSGTSTFHDWTMTSENGSFSGIISGNMIKDVRYSMNGKTLKSGKGAMDNNAYKAILADKFPNITFIATSINIGKGTMTGKLTVTNITKTINLPVNVTKSGDSYNISGTTTIKMTDYGINPPSMFLNTLKTGNNLAITINAIAN